GRYGVAWSAPAPRMREYVGAVRAAFASFQTGAPLRFEGSHYRLSRLQPFFRPDPLPDGARIPILLGAIGPAMTALAGELADGLVTHPTRSAPRLLREAVQPRLAHGAARAGRDPATVLVAASPLVAAGRDAAAVSRARERARRLLGFLFSTPAYASSLAAFGREARAATLHRLSREGRWDAMAGEIDDALLDVFVPSATWDALPDELARRYGGLARRLCLPLPDDPADDPAFAAAVARLRSGVAPGAGGAR